MPDSARSQHSTVSSETLRHGNHTHILRVFTIPASGDSLRPDSPQDTQLLEALPSRGCSRHGTSYLILRKWRRVPPPPRAASSCCFILSCRTACSFEAWHDLALASLMASYLAHFSSTHPHMVPQIPRVFLASTALPLLFLLTRRLFHFSYFFPLPLA